MAGTARALFPAADGVGAYVWVAVATTRKAKRDFIAHVFLSDGAAVLATLEMTCEGWKRKSVGLVCSLRLRSGGEMTESECGSRAAGWARKGLRMEGNLE